MELTIHELHRARNNPHSPKKGIIVTEDEHYVFDLRDMVYSDWYGPHFKLLESKLDYAIGIIWGIYSHHTQTVLKYWFTSSAVRTKVLYGAIRLGDTKGMEPKQVVQRFREVRDKLIKDDQELVQDPIKQLEYRCKHHDYWYMMSDDNRCYMNGVRELNRISELVRVVGEEVANEIWNKYCPEQLRRKV